MKPKIEYEDILYGDFHVHTDYTDGSSTILEYCQMAVHNRLRAIAFTEHVRRSLDYNFDEFLGDIDSMRERFSELKILSGCEAKVINIEGELDVSEELIDQCDIVIGVFHQFSLRDKKSYLQALKAMLSESPIDIWGHPTLFAKKNNIILSDCDLDELSNICIENSILIERNLRYNLPDSRFVKSSLNKGGKFIIGSDAHCADELLTVQRLRNEWRCLNKMC